MCSTGPDFWRLRFDHEVVDFEAPATDIEMGSANAFAAHEKLDIGNLPLRGRSPPWVAGKRDLIGPALICTPTHDAQVDVDGVFAKEVCEIAQGENWEMLPNVNRRRACY